MYYLNIKPELDKKLTKLYKKNRKHVQNPQHYKNLRAPLQHLKEVHIDKHFILTFSVDENAKTVTLEDFEHHDDIFS